MNSGRSDASTSTEDMKTRPLCLYYFTHPFGVLSPEPPRMATFAHAEPPEPSAPPGPAAPTACFAFDLANWARVNCASSWFSEDMWSLYGGRVAARLPPLRVRRLLSGASGGARTPPRGRRALPPLPVPPPAAPAVRSPRPSSSRARFPRKLARSLHTTFTRAAGRGAIGARGERVVPAAWAQSDRKTTCDDVDERIANNTMKPSADRAGGATEVGVPLAVQRGAPPGLLHRRYSAPETVMRKYRLEQLSSQESNRTLDTCPCGLSDADTRVAGAARRGALLRRLRGRVACACACPCAQTSRSLDVSRSELRSTCSASASGRTSPKRLRQESGTTLSQLGASSSAGRDATMSPLSDTDVHIASTSEMTYRDISGARLRRSGNTDVATICTESTDGSSFADSSDAFTMSMCTTRDAPRTEPSSAGIGADDVQQTDPVPGDVLPRESSVKTRPRSYDILEIVVSESLDTNYTSESYVSLSGNTQKRLEKSSTEKYKAHKELSSKNIDAYVSSILVESLNSLTDQLECMTASIGGNGKMNVIEKEIKIKLQNTGVNTIVHLSPTSNNQIIFGHEELCSSDERHEDRQGPSPRSQPAAGACARPDLTHHVNRAVLEQIQRLFQDDFQLKDRDARFSKESTSSISHTEISKANVYMENEPASYSTTAEAVQKPESSEASEAIGSVGAGNYYDNPADLALVARFSAFPHTESMEVNTSSSDDPDLHGSECASLVDSLDDPNSPRSLALNKLASRRNELVRSSIDVLDLLPENACRTESAALKDKGEAFFVAIKDDHCECDPVNKDIVVADHMPETIKQRLYKRHRNREMRQECARRSKAQQMRRELALQRHGHLRRARKDIERKGISLIRTLVDEAISAIVQDEIKCMRIKQKSVLMVSAKSDESLCARNRKKDLDLTSHGKKISKNCTSQSCADGIDKKYRKDKFQIRGKLSLQAYPSSTLDDGNSKRIYQKSEIHDGKGCIEILEILEYASSSASSTDSATSDDNLSAKVKKSRIPVPVTDRVGTQQIQSSKRSAISSDTTSPCFLYNIESTNEHSPSSAHEGAARTDVRFEPAAASAVPRASAAHCDPRSRSNSLRFKRVFDMIPEEKNIVSVETGSGMSDHMYSHRASLPTLNDDPSHAQIEKFKVKEENLKKNSTSNAAAGANSSADPLIGKATRSAGTSPIPSAVGHRSVLTQTNAAGSSTSPHRSAATSPVRNTSMSTQTVSPRRRSIPSQYPKFKVEQADLPLSLQRRREPQRGSGALPKARAPQPAPPPPGGGNGRREKIARRKEDLRLPRCGAGAGAGGTADCSGSGSSSSSGESGALLCARAPAWLHARRRRRRRLADAAGQWAVTVAGSCRAALPTDVKMRLRFPQPAAAPPPLCPAERCDARGAQPGGVHPAVALALTKEAADSSIVASKSVKKSVDSLPDVETFRASRTSTKHSVKTRRCSPGCWLPAGARVSPSETLSVRGAAIVPTRKPLASRTRDRRATNDHCDSFDCHDRSARYHGTPSTVK